MAKGNWLSRWQVFCPAVGFCSLLLFAQITMAGEQLNATAPAAPRPLPAEPADDGTVIVSDGPGESGVATPRAQRASSNASQKSGAPSAAEGKSMVMRAFTMTKTANSIPAYDEIIELCERGASAPLTKDTSDYAHKLAAWAYNRRGEAQSDAGQATLALEDFEAAMQLDPQQWRAVHNHGVTQAVLGKYDEAISDFNRTVQLNPQHGNAYFNRAELLYELGDYARAIQDYTQALKLSPQDSAAYNSRGHCYYRMERFRDAVADYNEALRLDPHSAAAMVNRGDVFCDLGYYDQAGTDYRNAMKTDPQLGRAFQSAAWLMATCPDTKFRNPQLALEAAKKAVEIDGETDYRYLETLAAAQACTGDFESAQQTQARVLQVVPKNGFDRNERRLELYRNQTAYRESPRQLPNKPAAIGRNTQ